MGQVKAWACNEQYCTVCGRGFYPLTTTHKFDMMRPTCSERCQNEFDQLMHRIADNQIRYMDMDDNNNWDG